MGRAAVVLVGGGKLGGGDRCGDWRCMSWEGIGLEGVRNSFEGWVKKRVCIFLVGDLNALTFAVHIAK